MEKGKRVKKAKGPLRSIYDLYAKEYAFQEGFRRLHSNIQFSSLDKPPKTVAVTSATPSEGKTTVCLGLAMASAEAGRKTLLMDADCRRPMLAARLQLRPRRNWMNVLYENCPLEEVVAPTKMQNLYFADTEPQTTHLSEIFNSRRFAAMMAALKEQFDVVIIDTPPLGLFIDAALLARIADGTVLVVRSGLVDIKRGEGVAEQLKKANANILGVVLNGEPTRGKREEYDYYEAEEGGKKPGNPRIPAGEPEDGPPLA